MSTANHRLARRAPAGASAVLAAAYAAAVMAHADALRAAGVDGPAPPNAGEIKHFVSTIGGNLLWLIGTCAVLAFLVLGVMFMAGHSRAPDGLMKVAMGALLVVCATGIAA